MVSKDREQRLIYNGKTCSTRTVSVKRHSGVFTVNLEQVYINKYPIVTFENMFRAAQIHVQSHQ